MHFRQVDLGQGRFRIESVSDQNEVVAWATVLLVQVRFSGTWVRAAGVAGVGTAPAYRRRGLARKIMEEVQARSLAAGHHLSFLFGIPNMYHKLGYSVTHTEHHAVLAVRDLPRLRSSLDVRPLTADDWPSVIEMYHADAVKRIGAIRRDQGEFRGFGRGPRLGYSVESLGAFAGDELLAYAVFDTLPNDGIAASLLDPFAVHVSEVIVRDQSGLIPLLQEAAERASRQATENIHVHGPPDHDLFRILRQCGSVECTVAPYSGGGMMRLLDLAALVTDRKDAWQKRLRAGGPPWQGKLGLIATDQKNLADFQNTGDCGNPEVVVEVLKSGELRLVSPSVRADVTIAASFGAWAQMLLGAVSPEHLVPLGRARITKVDQGLEHFWDRVAPPSVPYAYHDTHF